MTDPVLIYNLFPRLVGAMSLWAPHIDRAKTMGFNWLYINPISYAGFSGSLYSVKDYYRVNPLFLDDSGDTDEQQMKTMIQTSHRQGMKVMFDLVINHTAVDSVLVPLHPDWYVRKPDGSIKNPQVWEGDKLVTTWGDLAEIDNESSSDREHLWAYWDALIAWNQSLGVDGFRCDAAYQVPVSLWHYLIPRAKARDAKTVFFAETLGCEIEDVVALAEAGFDYTFNSSKWWDFKEPWCLKQYAESALHAPSVSFAESHDTLRLSQEVNGNMAAMKMYYSFSAFFSSAILMPLGFEFGFQKRVNVVKTLPSDWEEPVFDMSDFIRKTNGLKVSHRVFLEEGPVIQISQPNPKVVVLQKSTRDGSERALLIFNLDKRWHQGVNLRLEECLSAPLTNICDISIDYALDIAPPQLDYQLRPNQVMVWISGQK